MIIGDVFIMFVNRIKEKFGINEPIFTEDILNLFPEYSRAYVFRLIKDTEKSGELVKFAKGIYYLPRKTFYGISTITADSVIERRYLNWDNGVFGIYSGLKLMNLFSVTTQVPNVIEVVTNNETTRCREIDLDGRKFILRKSRLQINKDNADTYMILQLFSDLESNVNLDEFAKQRLIEYMQDKRISQKQLLSLAINFPARTMKKLIGSGILNEVA